MPIPALVETILGLLEPFPELLAKLLADFGRMLKGKQQPPPGPPPTPTDARERKPDVKGQSDG
jgi:hypothetical protein